VELLEIDQTGAMIAWYEKQSMEVVLSILFDLAQTQARASQDGPVELRPEWASVGSVFANSRKEFVQSAPAILRPEFRYCSSTLFVSGREVFVVTHLDQSILGVTFHLWDDTDESSNEEFASLVIDRLRKAPSQFPGIEFLLERIEGM